MEQAAEVEKEVAQEKSTARQPKETWNVRASDEV